MRMEEAARVTAYLKVTAEFYDPEATPETVRACVEQDLRDAGYEVEAYKEDSGDGRDYKQDYLDFVNLVTFFHFKKEGFQEPPPYHVAKSVFLGCLPEWRRKTVWISVKDRLPPEHDSIFAKFYGTKRWNPNMFQRISDDVRVAVRFEDGTRMVSHDHTVDGKWNCEMEKCAYPKRTVTHWCENPPLPEEE